MYYFIRIWRYKSRFWFHYLSLACVDTKKSWFLARFLSFIDIKRKNDRHSSGTKDSLTMVEFHSLFYFMEDFKVAHYAGNTERTVHMPVTKSARTYCSAFFHNAVFRWGKEIKMQPFAERTLTILSSHCWLTGGLRDNYGLRCSLSSTHPFTS